jgi:hypothetical protein
MASVALVSASAFVRAQESAAPVPVPLDAFGTSVTELPAIPFADGRASAREPALTIDRSAVTIEPIAPAAPAETGPSATEQRPANTFSVETTQSFEHAATAASLASLSTDANPASRNEAAKIAEVNSVEAEISHKTGAGGWILLGLVAAAIFISITRYRSRLPKPSSFKPVANLPLEPEPVPARVN